MNIFINSNAAKRPDTFGAFFIYPINGS